jgi:carboxypeptidase family protein/TonB-dependent receptor-like protein
MIRRLFTLCVTAALLAAASTSYGQGSTTNTLSGIVVDAGGGVVPGADVTVKHKGTGFTQSAVSNSEGAFSFPGLNTGTYEVTVKLTGFKTVVIPDVVLTAGAPAAIRATLEVGGLEEQVVVSSSSEIVQTQSTTIASTINTNQIIKLPLTSRSAMDFVNFLPGVSTPGGNRDATINGLPRGTINITLDGVNIQDNTLRTTDGFFAIVSPRLDAIEEVSVTTAGQGADVGQGAVQIKFVTRSGTNQFTGSGYHYYRSDKLNANTWFNNRDGNAKAKLKQNQVGVRNGGPIVIPGLFDGRNKAFYFFNYEEQRQPSDTTRNNRNVLNPAAQQGVFSYTTSSGVQSINVLDLAASKGVPFSTMDPTIRQLLADIDAATHKAGSLSTLDPTVNRYTFNIPVESLRRYPTARVDYNITDKHRFTSAFNFNWFTDSPDTLNNRDWSFPGFPVQAGQESKRIGWSNAVRSTLNQNLVNEARVGYSGAPVSFFKEYNVGMYTGSVANTKGFHLSMPALSGTTTLTNPGGAPSPSSRNATDLTIEDTLTWLKGSHNISMGGSFTRFDIWAKNQNIVPTLSFGLVSGDPALDVFVPGNLPGASQTQVNNASALFALLTGRISQLQYDARIDENTGQYVPQGLGIQRGRLQQTGLFVSDSWRMKPNLTLNAGLRYELQFPFVSRNDSYSYATMADVCGVSGVGSDGVCNLWQAGNMPGIHPTFQNLEKGVKPYDTDWNNIAPSVGLAWTPAARQGLLGTMMGHDGDFVVRGGWTRAYSRPGLNDFTGRLNANPGVVIQDPTRNAGRGNLGTVPVLFRNDATLGPGAFPSTPHYPLTDVVTEDVTIFQQNLQVPYADSYSIGIQRAITRNTALEVRYVGTRARENWQTVNYNEFNIWDNGFIQEFRAAQANLQANIAAGRGNTFAYTGAPGTLPLPVFLAFFNGQPASQAGNTAAYTGTNWTRQAYLNYLAIRNPNPFGFASASTNANTPGILGDATLRDNAAKGGLPANYFLVNPDLLGGAQVAQSIGYQKYNSLQVEVRRRLANGLQASGSYVYGHQYVSQLETLRRSLFYLRDTGTPGDLTHQWKANVVYDLPFGQGRHFGSNVSGVVDRIIGGWQFGWTAQMHDGRLIDLGNVRVVGMSTDDVQKAFKLRFDDSGRKVYMFPQDIIDQTINAFNVSATSSTGYSGPAPTGRYFAPANGPDCIELDNGADYGDCGVRSLVVHGPFFQQHDLRVSKRTRVIGRTDVEFAFEMLNAFNQANFVPVGGIGSTRSNYEVTGLTGQNTSRIVQLVSRINW